MRGKSWDGDKLIETIRGGQRCEKEHEILNRARGFIVGYGYKE